MHISLLGFTYILSRVFFPIVAFGTALGKWLQARLLFVPLLAVAALSIVSTQVRAQAVTANDVSATVAANSSGNLITLDFSSGAPYYLDIAAAPSHGTATVPAVSGNQISYTPMAGFSGSDSLLYRIMDGGGSTAVATVTITVSVPTLNLTPAAGTLPGATSGRVYSQTFSAFGGTASYTYSVSAGSLPAGLSLHPSTGTLSGTPTAPGTSTFSIKATDSSSVPVSVTRSYSLAVAAPPVPIAHPVSATVAANSSDNAIMLDLAGGTATSVAIASDPRNGTATVKDVSIRYTPKAGYSGRDSFTYTATNAGGSSGPVTVTITVTAPSLTFSPAAGPLPAAMVGTVYSRTITAAAGSAPYTYSLSAGSLPAGLTLDRSTGAIIGTATTVGNDSFVIAATDIHGATGKASYSLAVTGTEPPVAEPVSATVAANSSNNQITLDVAGGAADSVSIASDPGNGTAVASGTTIRYTPSAGFSGTDSFTYTATNIGGTSAPATVTITVTASTTLALSPAGGELKVGQRFTVSGGRAPYLWQVRQRDGRPPPAWLSFDPTTAVLTGTPPLGVRESIPLTITVSDFVGNIVSANYTFIIVAPPASRLTFMPAGGKLPEAIAGEDYSQKITVSGGNGAVTYDIASGWLPDGVTLNPSTGELSGTLPVDAEVSDYRFTLQALDDRGYTAKASFSLAVKPADYTAPVQVAVVIPPNGIVPLSAATFDLPSQSLASMALLDLLPEGAVFIQGPVPPSNAPPSPRAGRRSAAAGSPEGGREWHLKVTPNPAFSGEARVRLTLTSTSGTSTVGTLVFRISHDPDKVAENIDRYVHDFVSARQNMISSAIKVPGLLERRRMGQSSEAYTTRLSPSEDGMSFGFSTGLAQLEGSRNQADGISGGYSSPFNVWINGAFFAHRDDDMDDGKWGSFGLISLGADYLLSEKALVGLSFHYDRMTDPVDADAELTGNGWLAGPYASLELGTGVFWNGSFLYGGSSNDIDTAFWDGTFETRRWLADTSIEGQWSLGDDTTLTPRLRTVYFSEEVDGYAVRNDAGDAIGIDGFNEEQFRVSLGAEIARSFTLGSGATLTPRGGLTGGFSGLDGSGAFGNLTAGLALNTAEQWTFDFGLLFNIEGEGQRSVGARGQTSKRF